jgi:outer membrane protein
MRFVGAGAGLRSAASSWRFAVAVGFMLVAAPQARAETLSDVLVRAYQTNPQLNAERARQRGTDETIPQALAGYRPQIAAQLSAGLMGLRNLLPDTAAGPGGSQSAMLRPWSAGVTVNQTIFNGLKTANSVRQAESLVRSGREILRGMEQSVLLDAVTAYMGVLANQTLVDAQKLNVGFLKETLDTTRKRLDAGDVTPTDVAQAEARFARGNADLNAAEVNLAVSQATYKLVIGAMPGRLAPAETVDRLAPRQRDEAVVASAREHPAVLGATYDVDSAQYAVNIAQAAFWPTVSVQGNIQRQVETDTTLGTTRTDSASVIGQATVPIYDGGLAASQVRQAKETLAQMRLVLDRARTQAETAVAAAWVTNEGARIQITAAESEVKAATLALQGVQREAQAGQRTTLDVLNAQSDLMTARVRLIQAQRDRVIASYTLLSALGRLDRDHLSLATPDYDPTVHYHQVRDAWQGLRTTTPSGQ